MLGYTPSSWTGFSFQHVDVCQREDVNSQTIFFSGALKQVVVHMQTLGASLRGAASVLV